MCINAVHIGPRNQAGISLIELILFIVIISVGIAGTMLVMNVTSKASADPLQRKQALAIAEAMLEEVSLMPFTTCEPDAYVPDAACATPEAMGKEAGEARGSLTSPFDNVNDYHLFVMPSPGNPAGDIGNSAGVGVPPGYVVSVAVTQGDALGGISTGADVLRIAVTVAYNSGSDSIMLEGYRTRYAPTGMP